ncbi:hypothetical protein FGB62_27g14 [Gracilaria domingensis]|nr:hypothetical protein FGB62_27g14 [Gracilaria domingensis]
MYDRREQLFKFDCGVGMPFGTKGKENSFELPIFPRFHSKIKRLIDSLPDELFETRNTGETEIIQRICGDDLENFMLFLNSDVEPCYPWLHCYLTADTIISSNGSRQRDVDQELATEGNVDARRRSEQEAQSNDDVWILDGNIFGFTGISDRVKGLEDLLNNFLGGTQRKRRTNRYIEIWWLGRVVNEKFSDLGRKGNQSDMYNSTCKQRDMEFTIHLENLFAVYSGNQNIRDREAPDDEDLNQYYKEFCRRSRSPRNVLAAENVKPLCAFETHYWDLWNLPRCIPPALEDLDVQESTGGTARDLKFIGYMMGIVRDGLAKWTKESVAKNMDMEMWSPGVVIRLAQVEFDASDELCKQLLKHRRLHRKNCGSISPNAIQIIRVLWECQKYLAEAIEDNVYGSSDIQLML